MFKHENQSSPLPKITTTVYLFYSDTEQDGQELRAFATQGERDAAMVEEMRKQTVDATDGHAAAKLKRMIDNKSAPLDEMWEFFTDKVQSTMDSFSFEDVELVVDGEPVKDLGQHT